VHAIELDINQSETLQYKILSGPEWLNINTDTGLLFGIPEDEKSGNPVSISVTDSTGLTDILTTQLVVKAQVGVVENPREFHIFSPYPNPFNSFITIPFKIPEDSHVILVIYDILGSEIAVLQNGLLPAGLHNVVWSGKDKNGKVVSTGIYFYKFNAGEYDGMGKVLFLK